MTELGNSEKQEIARWANNRVENSHLPFRRRERAMLRFVRKEADILVATTIIESGLDIPNANTIFIDEAAVIFRNELGDDHVVLGVKKLNARQAE